MHLFPTDCLRFTHQLRNPEEEAKLKLEEEIRAMMDIAKSKIWEAVSKDDALAKSLIEVAVSSVRLHPTPLPFHTIPHPHMPYPLG